MSKLVACISIVLALLLPAPILAQTAMTVRAVNVRAGPDPIFPLVTWIPSGTPVSVAGCTEGWRWCDIVSGRTRGWVHAQYLTNVFRNRTPIVTFSVESYWDTHYRGRPWYADRSTWMGWGTPGFTPPPVVPRFGSPRG